MTIASVVLLTCTFLHRYPARVTDGGDLAYGVRKAARITQSQIKDKVTSSAQLTTDYLLFVVAAALIAAAGLASDDVVSTVASMLISPIMGPIMAFTYGASIFNFGWDFPDRAQTSQLLTSMLHHTECQTQWIRPSRSQLFSLWRKEPSQSLLVSCCVLLLVLSLA